MATVSNLKKQRTVSRRLFTLSYNTCIDKLSKGEIHEVRAILTTLNDRAKQMFEIEEKFKYAVLDLDLSEEETFKELDLEGFYQRETDYTLLKTRCEKLLRTESDEVSEFGNVNTLFNNKSSDKPQTTQRKFQLPTLELKQFDGDITNWLGFWGQFKKIDSDVFIDDDDKFQYLLKATEPGSSARELVESFPPSGPNYHKALEQMKARFAKDEILIQCYVRKLLDIVLSQGNCSDFSDLRTLYDKLNTQLRALETLGVTSEKYAAMLYPLVESAIPESTLRVWQRIPKNPIRISCNSC
ncbi:hypothetical protein K1T71_008704 [Dendrolimus kikuchii]|uniref:Uncharacterized protein n=1 Tax=Dendrolimus kikuchii TaxID=765133 RepID=A0ACC1CV95_9NEOP|nr:hypothetical protein K1T71_008704 [Dendrolimus kikuchii]